MKKQLFLGLVLFVIPTFIKPCDMPGFSVLEIEDESLIDQDPIQKELQRRISDLPPQELHNHTNRLSGPEYVRVTQDITSTDHERALKIWLKIKKTVDIQSWHSQMWQRIFRFLRIQNDPLLQFFIQFKVTSMILQEIQNSFGELPDWLEWLTNFRSKLLSEGTKLVTEDLTPAQTLALSRIASLTYFCHDVLEAYLHKVITAREGLSVRNIVNRPLHFNHFDQNGGARAAARPEREPFRGAV